MSKENEDIKLELAKFAGQFGPEIIVPATVLEVNADNTLKIEFSDESTVDDARLKSVVKDGNKVLFIPKVDSIVQVARIGNSDEYLVIAVEEIDEVVYIIGDYQFKMTDEGFVLTKGSTIEFSIKDDGFKIKKGSDTQKDINKLLIEAVQQIVVIQGNNPNYGKLVDANVKNENLYT